MADGLSITEPASVQSPFTSTPVKANIYGMDVNYSAQNKWFAFLPLESILGRKYGNLNLHLTRFSIPQLEMTSNTVSYRGYEKEVPSKVLNAGSKQLTLEYIVDEKWQNYRSLYAWMSCIEGTFNPVTDDEKQGVQPTDYIPLRIFLLDNFKRKIIQFVFENTWIKVFNDISLDVTSPAEVTHSFTISYDSYHIDDM